MFPRQTNYPRTRFCPFIRSPRPARALHRPNRLQPGEAGHKVANFTLTYLNSRGVHQLLSLVTNAPVTNYPYPIGTLPNPAIFQYSSDGVFWQNQFIAQFNVQAGARVSLVERDYMYDVYAQDKTMRLNLGIRRRLAPLLENDRRRIELMNGMLMSLPGTPIIYYGDEIGMGDNINLGDRNGVRTPMQWSGEWNGGFSKANPEFLYAPLIQNPVYGYPAVNVLSQRESGHSLLCWMRSIIAVRKSTGVFGRGSIEFLHPANHRILAYVRRLGNEVVLVVNNLSSTAQAVELDLRRYKGNILIEMSGKNMFPRAGDLPYLLTMGPYQFYWFWLRRV